ncbi:CPBP family intramembrane metalloprotease [Chitinophaga horti]|uniref:CPBP family intramembrane metalloprotease n=1 Tax=Chitinophaga horti TaxID=2920382 RepID=A0ABY6J480_9BACT|nr:CPBP family intramembrane glutamic endopeptidase [Chitinophaga horti]UYQ93017.1 CPBP family intramembrane metalloprotease [Chitinophaga horti]
MRVSSLNGIPLKTAWLILAKLYIALFIFSSTLFLLFITPVLQPGLWSYALSCVVIITYMLTAQSENFQIKTRTQVQPLLLMLAIVMPLALFVVRDILLKLIPLPSFAPISFATVQADSVAAIIGSSLLLPILEEILFRGIILEALLKTNPSSRALLQTTIIYAIATLNPAFIIPKFLLGLLCGFFYLRTRELCYPIVAHVIYNMAVVAMLASGNDGLAEALNSEMLYFLLILAACMLLPPAYYLLQRAKN